jgi:lipopolysaccharide/colanic/teichoic acid biosynthesis glycosyltransferase
MTTDISPVPDPTVYRGKRALDWTVLIGVALPALLLGAICATAVRLTSRGPVLFRQDRVGLCGKRFRIFKFRTMFHRPEGNSLFPHADEITPVGRCLRRLSLDELPQLLNVVCGDMSIVGPRPTLAYQVARYSERQRRRLASRPGLTGLAQVRGRNTLAWPDRIELDLEYVDRQSIALDLSILASTFSAVVRGSGVEGHPLDDPLARDDVAERRGRIETGRGGACVTPDCVGLQEKAGRDRAV